MMRPAWIRSGLSCKYARQSNPIGSSNVVDDVAVSVVASAFNCLLLLLLLLLLSLLMMMMLLLMLL